MYVCVCARALTQHGEDEVLGRVDLERALVVVLALLVLAELLDEAGQVLHARCRPEVELRPRGAARRPAGCRGGAVPEAARHLPSHTHSLTHTHSKPTTSEASRAQAERAPTPPPETTTGSTSGRVSTSA